MANQIDLDYRPNSYFWAHEMGVQLSSQIKGAQRKTLYDASVAEGEVSDLDEFLQKPSLSTQERDLIGKLHPSFMGGEYLPDKGNDEVEIARITINSTTQDVTSVYASLRENQIHYRVVDEYEGGTLSEENKSLTKTPMTLAEMTDFFLTAWPLLEVLEMNFGETDADPDDIRYFVLDASSSFYAQFGELIYLKVDEWLEEKGFIKNKEIIEELSEEVESLEDQHIKEWLDRSDWPRSTLRDALGLGARAENSQRKKAVFQYAKRYLDKNKAFPAGTHIIDEVVPTLGGDFSGIPSKFNFAVIFPEK
jgi:hypothetical protein